MKPSILIAGVGNIFLGDDGFGVEVASALSTRVQPEHALVKDFGIRGLDLAYTLLEPWEAVILVDTLSRGETPGTLYLVEPDIARVGEAVSPEMAINPHGMDPVRVLHLAASMGEIPAQVFVVGCEPEDFGDELEGRMGLSAVVQTAVEEACTMVRGLVERIRETGRVALQIDPTQLHTMER
jgi:hydrogenase maturation protease